VRSAGVTVVLRTSLPVRTSALMVEDTRLAASAAELAAGRQTRQISA